MERQDHRAGTPSYETGRRVFWLIVLALLLILSVGLPLAGYQIVSRFNAILRDQVIRDNEKISTLFERFLAETRRQYTDRDAWIHMVQRQVNSFDFPKRGYVCLIDSQCFLQAAPQYDPTQKMVSAKDWEFVPIAPGGEKFLFDQKIRTEELFHSAAKSKVSGLWQAPNNNQIVDFSVVNIGGEQWLVGVHEYERAVEDRLKEVFYFILMLGVILFPAIVIPFGIFASRLMRRHENERNAYIQRIEEHTQEIETIAGKLQSMNEDLNRLQNVKNRLYTRLSHDLRAPLNSISMSSEMVGDGMYGETTEKQRNAMQVVQRNVKVLLQLIDGILHLSQLESGQVSLDFSQFDLSALLFELSENLRPLALKKHLEFRYHPEEASLSIRTDREKLYLILQNLVSNAIQYTQDGFIELQTRLREEDTIAISVIDSGPGISEENRQKIFEEFTRVLETASQTKGVGLGLTISKELTQLLQGHIEIDSTLGQGTTFTLVLPQCVVSSSASVSKPV